MLYEVITGLRTINKNGLSVALKEAKAKGLVTII